MWKAFGMGRHSASLPATTLIATGTLVEGDVRFGGTLELEGTIRGAIRAQGDDHAVVRILPGGHVDGDVHAPIVVVNGLVTGNVYSSEHVELASGAIVRGDVEYSLIEMTKGAQVEGRLHFRLPASSIPDVGAPTDRRDPSLGSGDDDIG
jgi:cytoskeletal protein CcmA (bactofilin family)